MILVPNDSRWELSDLREGKNQAEYLDAVWHRRNAAYRMTHGEPIARGAWPFKRSEAEAPFPVARISERKIGRGA